MPGVLEGIRVLDFGRYIAGPYCAALLAEQGAEVIRIEKRQGSEDRYQAPVAATGEGARPSSPIGVVTLVMRPETALFRDVAEREVLREKKEPDHGRRSDSGMWTTMRAQDSQKRGWPFRMPFQVT